MFVPAQNVSDSPVLIDADGRTLGGGEWGAVDRHDPHAQQAIGDSRLVIHPDLEPTADTVDDARIALERAAVLEARRVELANLDADQLATLAVSAGLDIELDVETLQAVDVAALRRALVHVDPSRSAAASADASPVDDTDGDTLVTPARRPEAAEEEPADAPAIPPAKAAAATKRGPK